MTAAIRGRPFHVGIGCVAAGLGLSVARPGLAFAASLAALASLACCGAPRLGALAAGLLLAGAAVGDARLTALDASLDRLRPAHVGPLRAHLVTPPRPSAFGSSAEIVVTGGEHDGTRLLMRVPQWARLPTGTTVGDELVVRGRLRPVGASGEGGSARGGSARRFDFAAHLRRRGIAGELLLDRARGTGRSRGGLAGVLDAMRRRAERAVAAGLPASEAALARGMVLGQDEEIGEATRQDWRDSGLAHLLAVSGQNVMLLVALAVPLLAVARIGPLGRGVGLLAVVALYVPLAGAGPSLQRAGVMGAAGIAAMMLSRPASRWYALLLAAAATLALSPRASGDPGWQLSFAAVAGILIVGRPLAGALARAGAELLRNPERPIARALVRGFADGVAITVAATLATAPLVAFHFGAVPLVGLLANLLALPAVAPAMWLGMVKGALGLLGAIAPPADTLAGVLGPVTRVPLAYLGGVAERCAGMPGSRLSLPLTSPAEVCAAYAGIGIGVAGAAHARRRRRESPASPGPGFPERAAAWRRAPRAVRAGASRRRPARARARHLVRARRARSAR